MIRAHEQTGSGNVISYNSPKEVVRGGYICRTPTRSEEGKYMSDTSIRLINRHRELISGFPTN